MTTAGQVALTVVGAINVDLVASVQRAPAPGETVADGVLSRQPGGKGANQAVAAARLGARVRLVGAVGQDADGEESLQLLSAAGVNVAGVQRVTPATGTALIVVDATGENSIVVCPGANAAIDPAVVDVEGGALLAQLEVGDEVIEHAAARADGFFALNVSPVRELPVAVSRRADMFIVNEGEYAALPELRSRDLVVVTLGADGAVLLRRGEEVARAASPATSVISTVGAGDAFAAAMTVALLSGYGEEAALRTACAVGAAAVADSRSQPLLGRLESYARPA